jgi:hypothetical protein
MPSHSNRKAGLNLLFLLGVIAICAAGLATAIYFLTSEDKSLAQDGSRTVTDRTTLPETPPAAGIELPLVQLDGTWTAERNGSKFVATVKDDTIDIQFGDNLSSMTYWYGTFKMAEEQGASIDSKLIDDRVVMSRAKSKSFQLKDDALWFEFKAMGMTTKVGLIRA